MKGKISVIAKTGGIKVEGDDNWYNPASPAVKKFLLAKKDDLLNSEVELVLNEEGKIERVLVNSANSEQKIPQEKITEEKPDRDCRIIRQNVLGHSTKIVMQMYEKAEETLTSKQLVDKIKEVAQELEEWVNR